MAAQLSEADIWAARYNVSLARSKNVLRSWLPDKPDDAAAEEDESDFKAMSESAGLGSTPKDDDSDIPDVLRKSRASNDKLLEQLLGKKAAQAKKKSLASKHSISKPMAPSRPAAPAPADSHDEEDIGRAAAFSSKKKTRDNRTPAYQTAGGYADAVLDVNAEPPDPREDSDTVKELVQQAKDDASNPKKRKAASYLDELLAQKAKKKSKKKKGTAAGAS